MHPSPSVPVRVALLQLFPQIRKEFLRLETTSTPECQGGVL